MNTHRLPLDRAPHHREHPGESIDDTRNWPGLGLIGLGIATLGMLGWSLPATGSRAGPSSQARHARLFFMAGASIVVAEHAHVKHMEHRHLRDHLGH